MAKKCSIFNANDILKKLLYNDDGTRRQLTTEQVTQEILNMDKNLSDRGILGFRNAVLQMQKLKKTDQEFTKEDEARIYSLKERITKSKKPILEELTKIELEELRNLLIKAKLFSIQNYEIIQVLDEIVSMVETKKPRKTIEAKILLEKALDRATTQADTRQIKRIKEALSQFERGESVTEALKIDFAALQENREKIKNIQIEIVLLKTIMNIADSETAKTRAKVQPKIDEINQKINKLRQEIRKAEQNEELDDVEYQEEKDALEEQISELVKERNKLQTKLLSDSSKTFKAEVKELERKIIQLELEIQKLTEDNQDLQFVNYLSQALPYKNDFYLSSLRDLMKRKERIEDNIKFVQARIEETPDDFQFNAGFVERLFDTSFARLPLVRAMFREEESKDGTVNPATNKKVFKDKEFITKTEIKELFEIWKSLEEENMYDDSLDSEQSKVIEDLIIKGDRKVMSDVDDGYVPVASQSRAEANKQTKGSQYDTSTQNGRISLIKDLMAVKARLNALTSMPQFNGTIPEWALVSALGSNAQSLFTLFDGDTINPQELRLDDFDQVPADDNQRRIVLQSALQGMGLTDMSQIPELTDMGWLQDFNSLVGISIQTKPNSSDITLITATIVNKKMQPEIITFEPKEGQTILDSEVALEALVALQKLQANGYKVVGHDTLSDEGGFAKLALLSGNAQLAFTVALRSYDTGMVAFRAGTKTSVSRFNKPSLESLANAYYKEGFTFGTPSLKERGTAESFVATQVLLGMHDNRTVQKPLFVSAGSMSRTESIQIREIVPLWYDTKQPGTGYNPNYLGMSLIYDIQPFQNIKDIRGSNAAAPVMYSLENVDTTVTNLLILAMDETNPDELDNVISGLITAPSKIDEHYERVLRLSQLNHEAYMNVKRKQREKNDNRYLIEGVTQPDGSIRYNQTSSREQYITKVLEEFKSTIAAYKWNRASALQRFAILVDFREQKNNESIDVYTLELFKEVNKQFNGKAYSFEDYGNGTFDYIPATQLGRGFAQIVLGHIKPGNTLTQKIDSPVTKMAKTREELASQGEVLDIEDYENEVLTKSFLPLKMTNVSFFAPMNDFEQERVYGDWALRKRMMHILKHKMTDADFAAWEKFKAENQIIEYRNKIREAKRTLNEAKEKEKLEPTDANKTKTQEALNNLNALRKEQETYLKTLDEKRLELGRIQRYYLINPGNNRDLYTRIPTEEEALAMSIEIAQEIPQFIASLVHDSINYLPGQQIHVAQQKYIRNPAMSGGGPVGRVTLAGVHSLAAHIAMNPEIYYDEKGQPVNISVDVVKAAMLEGYKAQREGMQYSKSTYFDDKFSGIHHLLAMQIAYFGRDVRSTETRKTILEEMIEMLNTGKAFVLENELEDYYSKTYIEFENRIAEFTSKINSQSWNRSNKQADLDSIKRITAVFKDLSSSEKRTFFKGTVIPIIYSGGRQAVISDLTKRKASSVDANLKKLTANDIEVIATLLADAGTVIKGRLIDQILFGNEAKVAENAANLAKMLVQATPQLTSNYTQAVQAMVTTSKDLQQNVVSISVMKKAIRQRLQYVAELSIPQIQFTMVPAGKDPVAWRQELISRKVTELEAKWQSRIDQAQALIEDYHKKRGNLNPATFNYELGTELEQQVLVALAGGMHQFKQQASLLFLNKIQNSGYIMQTGDETMLEHQVKTGKNIEKNDIMFGDMVVFMPVAFGTSTGRMEYPGNYYTGIQSSGLSKGIRMAYKPVQRTQVDPATGIKTTVIEQVIDWDETTNGSMWLLTENPLGNMSKEDALQRGRELMVKTLALLISTDHEPSFLGYDIKTEEDRTKFFEDWTNRSERERTFANLYLKEGKAMREAYKELYLEQQRRLGVPEDQIKALSDAEIDKEIESNSVPFAQREGIRTMVLPNDFDVSGTLITNKDAKGLAAMRPRISDFDVTDSIVHGLHTIYNKTKQLRVKTSKLKMLRNRAKDSKANLSEVIASKPVGSSVYDPEQTPYIPVQGNSLGDVLLDAEPSILQKVNRMRFVLDTFAIEHGFTNLSKNGDYARLYIMYQIHQKTQNYLARLHRFTDDGTSTMEFKFRHREFMLDLFKITRFQRDALVNEGNIIDLKKAISIDPSKFKDRFDGSKNMMYLDALVVLEKLGAFQDATLQYGIAPDEMKVLGDQPVDVLKDVATITKPFAVQGRDVALLVMEVLADGEIKKEATNLVLEMIKNNFLDKKDISFDKQGYVILSTVPEQAALDVIKTVMQNDTLVDAAANNLNIYLTMEFGINTSSDFNSARITIDRHKDSLTSFVIPRPGMDPTVNRVKVGPQFVKFLLTAEGAKRALTGARNNGLFTKLEASLQTNKILGTKTNVDSLRSSAYGDRVDDYIQHIAEETEILTHLHTANENNPLRSLVTTGQSKIKDELGLRLNPWDSISYFEDDGTGVKSSTGLQLDQNSEYFGLTPFWAIISSPVTQAIQKGNRYPALSGEVQKLKDLMSGNTQSYLFKGAMMIVYLRSNTKELSQIQYRALVEEAMGFDLVPDEDFEQIEKVADQVMNIVNTIQFAKYKGKNKYRYLAVKALEEHGEMAHSSHIPTIRNIEWGKNPSRNFKFTRMYVEPSSLSKEEELKAQALAEAKAIFQEKPEYEAYADITNSDLMEASYNETEYEAILATADGTRINAQIQVLINTKVINESTAIFYRYLIANILKTNPQLGPLLSITSSESDSAYAGEAIKDGDRFKINLNTKIMRQMGTVDQVRVFAHEAAHIARMAFIRDNSTEWRKLEALVNSRKGRQTIETMLLTMNNGKKYIGFDEDAAYYMDNAEEFIAQWGAWILMQKTFKNEELSRYLQSRSQGAMAIHRGWGQALAKVEEDIANIGLGLHSIEDGILAQIMEITETMFNFTGETHRELFVDNANRRLFQITSITKGLDDADLTELKILKEKKEARMLTPAEETKLLDLQSRYNTGIINLDKADYIEARKKREQDQTNIHLTRGSMQPGPGKTNISMADLLSPSRIEGKEVIQTLIMESMATSSQVSRSNQTIGGLSRTIAEKIFRNPKIVDAIVNRRSYINGNATGSAHTFENPNALIASLMHIIGDTLSVKEHQFQGVKGTNSIRENRYMSKFWLERIIHEMDNLKIQASSDNYVQLQQLAYEMALGRTVTISGTKFSSDEIKAATKLAKTIKENAQLFSDLIFGDYSIYMDSLPIHFNADLLGSNRMSVSKAKRDNQWNERKELHTELSKAIQAKIALGKADGLTAFLLGILPNQTEDLGKLAQEMARIKNSNKDAFNAIMQFTSIKLGQNPAFGGTTKATLVVQAAFNRPTHDFLHVGSLAAPSEDAYLVLDAVKDAVNEMYTNLENLGRPGGISVSVAAATTDFESAVKAASTSTNPTSIEERVKGITPPSAIQNRLNELSSKANIYSESNDKMQKSAPEKGTAAEVLATFFLQSVNEDPKYTKKNQMVNLDMFISKPELLKFISFNVHSTMYEVEKSQGFRAASQIAVYKATGIAGIDVYQLIDIIKAHLNSIYVKNPQERRKLQQSIALIEEKLQIEQGLSLKELQRGDTPMLNLMVKYGPEITRLVYGANLNTASIIAEGGLGVLISTMYGGSPLLFLKDTFGSLFSTYFGANMTRLEQRNEAVNLLLGMEKAIQDSREIMHIADTTYDKNASKMDKLRNWIRANNNRGYISVLNAMSAQSQLILTRHLKVGNLDKLQAIFNGKTPPKNMDELSKAMREAKLKGNILRPLRAHMAYEMNVSGILQPGVLDAYKWMLANVKSKQTNRGYLDIQAAGHMLETIDWEPRNLASLGITFSKQDAYKAIQAVLVLNRAFTNIVSVENNPWDSSTSKEPFMVIFMFYRQYSHLFQNQKVMRLGSKMHMVDFALMAIGSALFDFIYNVLLLIALGALTFASLNPISEDFLYRKDPKQFIKFVLARNPIFSTTGNFAAEMALAYYDAVEKHSLSRFKNPVSQKAAGIKAGVNTLDPDFVPLNAFDTLATNVLTLVAATPMLGGNMNEQATWDIKSKAVNLASRTIPLLSELPFRIAANELLGDRPVSPSFRNTGGSKPTTQKPTVNPATQKPTIKLKPPVVERPAPKLKVKPEPPEATNPITAPKGLFGKST